MIEKPNITDEQIISVVQENYSIPITGVKFLPLGLDSSAWAYRLDAENATYFLKLRKGIPNPAGILIPRFLKEQGIEQVMAPLSTQNGVHGQLRMIFSLSCILSSRESAPWMWACRMPVG